MSSKSVIITCIGCTLFIDYVAAYMPFLVHCDVGIDCEESFNTKWWKEGMIYPIFLCLLILGVVLIIVSYVKIRHRITKAWNRLTCITCSTHTCDAEQHLITPKNGKGAHGITPHCAISIEDETEPEDSRDEPEIYFNGNLFHRPFDTTLQQSSVKKVHDIMSSVGLLFDKKGARGSVVRVGSKYVITAWHVVEPIVCPNTKTFNKQPTNVKLLSASDVYIDFNEYCRQSPKETHFKICPKIVFVDYQWDIIILEIFGKEEFLPEPLCSFSDVSDLNTTGNDVTCVHVIGKHPQREQVVADMSCTIIDRNDKRVEKAIKWTKKHTQKLKKDLATRKENPNMVSTAYCDVKDTMHRLIFDTHLEYGGSGGAVVIFTPAGDLALVAILTHGLPPFRCFYLDIPTSNKMEVGTTLKAIITSPEWKTGMEKIKEDIFNMHADMETDGQMEEMDTDERVLI